MKSHAPENYACPICLGISGDESELTLIRESDIVFRDDLVTVFISSFFIGNNPGHVVIVPNQHFENLYDISEVYIQHLALVSQKVSKAVRANYTCQGVTILQNNEPVGGQHAFHYHVHVFPRYENDELHKNMLDKKSTTVEEREMYAQKLKGKI